MMGYPFEPLPVRDAGRLPLSGASTGSAGLYDHGIGQLTVSPEAAREVLTRALRISPAFVMAQVALAHLHLREVPGIGRALVHVLAPQQRTAREDAHLAMLAAAGGGCLSRTALRRHLGDWPTDTLARQLLVAPAMAH